MGGSPKDNSPGMGKSPKGSSPKEGESQRRSPSISELMKRAELHDGSPKKSATSFFQKQPNTPPGQQLKNLKLLPAPADYNPNTTPFKPHPLYQDIDFKIASFSDMSKWLEHVANLPQIENPIKLSDRPGFLSVGKETIVEVNSFQVTKTPVAKIAQYAVDIMDYKGISCKKGLCVKIWNLLLPKFGGNGWMYDGQGIAWNIPSGRPSDFAEIIDMHALTGQGVPDRKDNQFKVHIKFVKKVNIAPLLCYLHREAEFTPECYEAINLMDQILRTEPAKRLTNIRRSYFDLKNDKTKDLGRGVFAVKGVYQSIRPAMTGLIVNVDVSNTCFWQQKTTLMSLVMTLAHPVKRDEVISWMNERNERGQKMQMHVAHQVQRLRRIRFNVNYPNMPPHMQGKSFVLSHISDKTPKNAIFEKREKDGDEEKVTRISVDDYFKQRYRYTIAESINMPVAITTKNEMFPLEVCYVADAQKYNFKLNEEQTSAMIKFAVTRPQERKQDIFNGLKRLDWDSDRYHKGYQIGIDRSFIKTKARILEPPIVEFRNAQYEKPGFSGRWRLDGKMFIREPEPLYAWGVIVFDDWSPSRRDNVNEDEVRNFISMWCRVYKSHGGELKLSDPPLHFAHRDMAEDVGSIQKKVQDRHCKGTGEFDDNKKEIKEPVQLFVIIANGPSAEKYTRVKLNMDIRFGSASQVLLSKHVKKVSQQYISNVCMKVWAKRGGFAQRVAPAPKKLHGFFKKPTLIIGADVSHPGAGFLSSSVSALTMSMDRDAMFYVAKCQNNGHREETISTWNIFDALVPFFRQWIATVGKGSWPQHIYYFRDGVSESEYLNVVHQEVRDIRGLLHQMDNTKDKVLCRDIKYTVIVGSKRHHVRFFPKPGSREADRNGNPLPGTVVERDITHPFQYDFYMCAHSAIQGTARPVHYHVLLDEAHIDQNQLMTMIYVHSYQYARSTTPVSLHPAIYYAHLAAKRAVAHEAQSGKTGEDYRYTRSDEYTLLNLEKYKKISDRTGKLMTDSAIKRLGELRRLEYPNLRTMPRNSNNLHRQMWFI